MNDDSKYENVNLNSKTDSELFYNIYTTKTSEIYISKKVIL